MYIIFPADPSTDFLKTILKKIKKDLPNKEVNIITVEGSEASYIEAKEKIKNIPDEAFVLFLGHGTSKSLYGGCTPEYPKEDLLVTNDMYYFKGKELFLLSCFSSDLLRSSRKIRGFSNSIGFGALPSDMHEANSSNKISKLGLSHEDISEYCLFIAHCIPDVITHYFKNNYEFEHIEKYLTLLMNKEINKQILEKKNKPLANLIFHMKQEISVI